MRSMMARRARIILVGLVGEGLAALAVSEMLSVRSPSDLCAKISMLVSIPELV